MKKSLLLLAASFAFIISYGKQDTLKVKSTIKKATVFLNGAQITRTAKAQVSTGKIVLKFHDLSNQISANSIQIKSKQDIVLLSIVHQSNFMNTPEKKKEIKDLEEQIEKTRDKVSYNQSIALVLKHEESMILSNKSLGSEQEGVSVDELRKTADFYRERLTEIKLKQLEMNRKLLKYNKEINKISRQLNALNAKKELSTGEIIVTLSSKKNQKIKLSISYLVNDARWSPKYDLRAINVSNPIDLIYKADLSQNTGYDWENIELTLSTGEPFKSGTKPELETWRLRYISGKSDKTGSGHGSSSTTYTFKIKVPYTILSDGKEHTIDVIKYSVPTQFQNSAVPKLEPKAFLIARITEWEQYHLLNGDINLFFEGTFVGKSYLDVNIPEDTLSISLGADKNVVIKREKLKDFTKKQLIGSKKEETVTYEIKIRNNKKSKIKLVVEDQIPVSSNNQIKVELIEKGGAEYDEEKGSLKWEFDLEPSKRKEFRFQYSVKYPKEKTISNL